ncbi:hypothetical protein MNVI_16610 [Mycobacterium noviomagense]|uniref:GNAT family N-acetyltransferase n=1 Tax=Mycobacterium noviomagense TaxID=459858 RepID=A0A7I7PCJ7_9MYCO|nr:hypothetical protein BST37_12870 [Mycobacterium noviomagense]BBY06343.1 hypothetical protein MNVI_16610 [Mycobacterium noviomagense]
MLVRREQPHPGAQLRFTDLEGSLTGVYHRPAPADLAYVEALYTARPHGMLDPQHENTGWLT